MLFCVCVCVCNLYLLLQQLQVSRVEAKPHLTPEQKRKSDIASALFTGLSGPSRPVKTKEKSVTLEVIKREGQTRSLSESSGTDMLLDLQVSMRSNVSKYNSTKIPLCALCIHYECIGTCNNTTNIIYKEPECFL